MSYDIKIKDGATPMLQELEKTIRGGQLENAMAQGAANRVRKWLFRKNQTNPNKLGGRRTNFWSGVAKSTSYTSQVGRATVIIDKIGFAQRLHGGFIKAKNKKYLTIPAVPEAYGRRAREFSDLRFGFTEGKYGGLVPALVRASRSRVSFGRRKRDGSRTVKQGGLDGGGEAMYWLVKRVFQQADPSSLPPAQEITDAAMRGATEYLRDRKDLR